MKKRQRKKNTRQVIFLLENVKFIEMKIDNPEYRIQTERVMAAFYETLLVDPKMHSIIFEGSAILNTNPSRSNEES